MATESAKNIVRQAINIARQAKYTFRYLFQACYNASQFFCLASQSFWPALVTACQQQWQYFCGCLICRFSSETFPWSLLFTLFKFKYNSFYLSLFCLKILRFKQNSRICCIFPKFHSTKIECKIDIFHIFNLYFLIPLTTHNFFFLLLIRSSDLELNLLSSSSSLCIWLNIRRKQNANE